MLAIAKRESGKVGMFVEMSGDAAANESTRITRDNFEVSEVP